MAAEAPEREAATLQGEELPVTGPHPGDRGLQGGDGQFSANPVCKEADVGVMLLQGCAQASLTRCEPLPETWSSARLDAQVALWPRTTPAVHRH